MEILDKIDIEETTNDIKFKTTLVEFLYMSFGENKEKTAQYLTKSNVDVIYDNSNIPYNVEAFLLQYEEIIGNLKKELVL